MSLPSFETFSTGQRAAGADEVLERRWKPNQVIDTHTHPFTANALIVQGEMWLTVGNDTQHLRTGDRFEVIAETPHSERYGPDGAVYWVARRNRRT